MGQQDQDAISVDRMLYDRVTGTRTAHRVLIPMATAVEVPTVAEQPDVEVSDLYCQLAEAAPSLSFTEHVTARTPYPDERRTRTQGRQPPSDHLPHHRRRRPGPPSAV
ncbi:hypothetical protein ACWDBW_26055 [Streptomyces sp. NPDC001107]